MAQAALEDMRLPEPDLEELLADAIDLDQKEQKGRLEVISSALELGEVLAKARSLTGHGYWVNWLEQTGIPRQRAHERIQLWGLGLSAQEILEGGGIKKVLRQQAAKKAEPATPPVPADVEECARELAQAEAEVGSTKGPYYAALTRRRRAAASLRKAQMSA